MRFDIAAKDIKKAADVLVGQSIETAADVDDIFMPDFPKEYMMLVSDKSLAFKSVNESQHITSGQSNLLLSIICCAIFALLTLIILHFKRNN